MEGESQRSALSPSARVSEESLPVFQEKQILGELNSVASCFVWACSKGPLLISDSGSFLSVERDPLPVYK